MRDLNRTTANLITLGLELILSKLQAGTLPETEELFFSNLARARRTQALLYQWLWFYPEIKSRITLRLDVTTGTLYLIPRGKSETRGRGRLI